MVPLVAKHVEEHSEQLVLDLGRPRGRQPPVARLDRCDLAFAVLPGRQRREEDVVAAPGDVAPPGRPLLVHRDDVAVHPEQVQPEIAQQLVPVGVPARFRPRRDLRAGRRLDFEVAPHDGREVLGRLSMDEKSGSGKKVGREDEPAVRVHDKRFHLVSSPAIEESAAAAAGSGSGVRPERRRNRARDADGVSAVDRRRPGSPSIQVRVWRRWTVTEGSRSAHGQSLPASPGADAPIRAAADRAGRGPWSSTRKSLRAAVIGAGLHGRRFAPAPACRQR